MAKIKENEEFEEEMKKFLNWRKTKNKAKEKAYEMKERADDFVHQKPWTSIAIGAVVGAAITAGIITAVMGRKKSFLDRIGNYF